MIGRSATRAGSGSQDSSTTCSASADVRSTPIRTWSSDGGTRPNWSRRDTRTATVTSADSTASSNTLGPRGFDRPVWHCAVRAAPQDRMLSDDEWAQIAGDIMHRTGVAPYGQEDDAVRWVAVRHGDDHIHIVAMLARQDGGTSAAELIAR